MSNAFLADAQLLLQIRDKTLLAEILMEQRLRGVKRLYGLNKLFFKISELEQKL